MGRPPKIKKEEFDGPNINLPLNIASNLSNKTTNPKPNIIDERSFRNDLLLARPDPPAYPIPNEHVYSSLYGREMELMRKMFKAEERLDGSQHHYGGAGGVDVDNLHKYEKPFSPAAMFPLAPGQQSPAPYTGGYFDTSAQRFHPDQEHQMAGDHAKDVDSKAMVFPPPGYPFSPASMVRLAARKMEEDAAVDSKPHPGLLKPMYNDRKLLNLNYLHCKTKSSLQKPTVNYRTTAADGRGYDNLSPQHEPLTPRVVGSAAAATGGFLLSADPDDYARYNFNVNNNYSDTSKNEQPSPTPFLSSHNQMNHVNSSNMNKTNHSKMNNSNKGGSNNNDYYYFHDAVEYNLSKSMKSDMAMADYEVAAARHSPSMSPRNKSGPSKHLLALNETKSKDTDLGDDEGTMHLQLGAGQEDKTRSSGGGKTQSDDVDDDRDDEFMNL